MKKLLAALLLLVVVGCGVVAWMARTRLQAPYKGYPESDRYLRDASTAMWAATARVP